MYATSAPVRSPVPATDAVGPGMEPSLCGNPNSAIFSCIDDRPIEEMLRDRTAHLAATVLANHPEARSLLEEPGGLLAVRDSQPLKVGSASPSPMAGPAGSPDTIADSTAPAAPSAPDNSFSSDGSGAASEGNATGPGGMRAANGSISLTQSASPSRRNCFYLREYCWQAVRDLPERQQLKLFRGLFEYAFEGKQPAVPRQDTPRCDKGVYVLLSLMIPEIRRDLQTGRRYR